MNLTYIEKYARIHVTKGEISVKILENYKNKKIEKVLEKAGDNVTGLVDLIGDKEPSLLFYLMADKLIYLLDNNPEKAISKKGIELRKLILLFLLLYLREVILMYLIFPQHLILMTTILILISNGLYNSKF